MLRYYPKRAYDRSVPISWRLIFELFLWKGFFKMINFEVFRVPEMDFLTLFVLRIEDFNAFNDLPFRLTSQVNLLKNFLLVFLFVHQYWFSHVLSAIMYLKTCFHPKILILRCSILIPNFLLTFLSLLKIFLLLESHSSNFLHLATINLNFISIYWGFLTLSTALTFYSFSSFQ